MPREQTLRTVTPAQGNAATVQAWDAVCETEGIDLVSHGTAREAHHAASVHTTQYPTHTVTVIEEGVA